MNNHPIVVPLDGSQFSEHALPAAMAVARTTGHALRLVQVHVPYFLTYVDSMAPFDYQQDRTLREGEQEHLDTLAVHIAERYGLPCTGVMLEGPDPADAINRQADKDGASLIVITTHGRGPMSRFWLGSVTDELIRTASCSVLAIPPSVEPIELTKSLAWRRILVPLDGSPAAEKILEPVVTLQFPSGPPETHYHLVRTCRDAAEVPSAQAYLAQVAQKLEALHCHTVIHTPSGLHPSLGILQTASDVQADLIAMETHGFGGFKRLRLGSVTDKVLRAAGVPVLTHRSLPPMGTALPAALERGNRAQGTTA